MFSPVLAQKHKFKNKVSYGLWMLKVERHVLDWTAFYYYFCFPVPSPSSITIVDNDDAQQIGDWRRTNKPKENTLK